MTIAVTGASGGVGSRVARLLAAGGHDPRLVVREPARAPDLPGADVRQARSYAAREEMRAALDGADTVFLIPATESIDRVEQHRTALEAALEAGASRLVYLSFLAAAPDATFTFARDHWHTEQLIRATGLPWTFLRMSLFTDYLPGMVGADGVIRGPAGDGRFAPVLRDDVAAAAAATLADHAGDGRTYDLTGPRLISLAEVAATLARHRGEPVAFRDETDEEAYASRGSYGAAPFEVDGWVSSYQAIRDGSFAVLDPAVEDLTGRPARSLADFLAAPEPA
jgi:uncharacterized protein YbjT (DUF2867 family)